jgi:predicted hotdog family 3-hydroxylacyl-ACP dehydratase
MSGGVSADADRILVRQVRMAAGLLSGTGQGEMDPQKNLSGRFQIELRAQSVQARATLAIAGTLENPQFRRSN